MSLKPLECKARPPALICQPFSTTFLYGENHAANSTAMTPLAGLHRQRETPFWQTPNALWLPAGSFSIYAAPSSLPTATDRSEMESALRASKRLVALATSTRPTELTANAFILRDKNYGSHSLQRQFRQQVQKASQHCGVEPLDWPTLSRLGLPVNRALVSRGGERFKTHAGFAPEKIHLAVVTHPRWRPILEKIPRLVPSPIRRRFAILCNLEAPGSGYPRPPQRAILIANKKGLGDHARRSPVESSLLLHQARAFRFACPRNGLEICSHRPMKSL